MSPQKLSALESALLPPPDPDKQPTPCVLLQPGAPESGAACSVAPSKPDTPAEEDESADPVGDGHSDADLARQLDESMPSGPGPQPGDLQPPGREKGPQSDPC